MGMREWGGVEKTVSDPCSYSNRLLSESSKTAVPKVGPWTHSVSITWERVEMRILRPSQDLSIPKL